LLGSDFGLSLWWIVIEIGEFSLFPAGNARWLALGVEIEKLRGLRLRSSGLGPWEIPAQASIWHSGCNGVFPTYDRRKREKDQMTKG
jgi:hypothetical protein